VNPFALYIALAAVLGLAWVALDRSHPQLTHRATGPFVVLDQAAIVLLVALLGGRAGYVIVHIDYYAAHPNETFQTWLGGLSGAGALLGGWLGMLMVSLFMGGSALYLADRLARLAALLAAASWLGCWQVGSAYGLPSGSWWAMPAVDEWGTLTTRLPVQLIGALFALAWMAFLDWRVHSVGDAPPVTGLRSAAWLLGMGISLVALSFWRADPALLWFGWRVDAWGGVAVAGVGLVWLIISFLVQSRSTTPD
jgi:phosphatidylglycerol:prolipoprotein diacylglycerol transferase